ncbi:unnamed protein product [Clonostachys rosea]|uniref:Phosphomevalonate dehydratase large subunit-like domain-containing protein n=1 Tax=Bionectria ochroleuca TaxID=29856 RepID=A0ABY6U888_BIOOC|nr:unnamed protein product [Clonostachys rosea]
MKSASSQTSDLLIILFLIPPVIPYSFVFVTVEMDSASHATHGRVVIEVPTLAAWEDFLFPLLGYHICEMVESNIPFILGLENTAAGIPELKAFGAGFATTSSAPMFHINGITREAADLDGKVDHLPRVSINKTDLQTTWGKLNTAADLGTFVDVVSLGNPHFSLDEFERLVDLTSGRTKRKDAGFIITTNRYVYGEAAKMGYIDEVERFGAQLITDTCWCMLQEPVIPPKSRTIMANSAKYAHYGPGVSKRTCHSGSMAACVDPACTGDRALSMDPSWLFETPVRLNLWYLRRTRLNEYNPMHQLPTICHS